MNRILAISAGVLCAVALVAAADGTKYGKGVTLDTPTSVASLLATPDAYLGKTVRVDGVVTNVCQEMGCWIELGDTEKGPGLQFKVDDGVIVFPKDAKGRRASAEGTFEAIGTPDEAALEQQKKSDLKTPPRYRIKAVGAVVY
jgi:hypothetical protein